MDASMLENGEKKTQFIKHIVASELWQSKNEQKDTAETKPSELDSTLPRNHFFPWDYKKRSQWIWTWYIYFFVNNRNINRKLVIFVAYSPSFSLSFFYFCKNPRSKHLSFLCYICLMISVMTLLMALASYITWPVAALQANTAYLEPIIWPI